MSATPHITWEDIPRVDDQSGTHDVRDNLARLLRFAMSYLSCYRPCLGPTTPPGITTQPWFYNLITRPGINLRDDRVRNIFSLLDTYCERLVYWCFELSQRRDPADLLVTLFDFEGYAGGIAGPATAPPTLIGSTVGFDRLVVAPGASNLADIFYSISSERVAADRRGLGIFLDQLFRACRLY